MTRRRPWGTWRVLARGPGFQVKRLEVRPGHRLSLQYHRKRTEHWVVVAGRGTARAGRRTRAVRPGSTLDVPIRAWHRLRNTGRTPLIIIEVQRGTYLGEDDIVRLADDYGR